MKHVQNVMQHERIIVVVIRRCCNKSLCKCCEFNSMPCEVATRLWYLKKTQIIAKKVTGVDFSITGDVAVTWK